FFMAMESVKKISRNARKAAERPGETCYYGTTISGPQGTRLSPQSFFLLTGGHHDPFSLRRIAHPAAFVAGNGRPR
ncbi:MAG: hypothetical protein LBH14_00075, partial [Desulfobulbaceae bacterium]|nr:hypothetical protein [Desulfobulbaceae bacterium]